MFKKYISRIAPVFASRDKLGLYVADVGYIEAYKNYECKTRVLSDYYLIVVLNGKGSFVSKDKHYDLKKGDMYFLFPNVLHSYKTDEFDLLTHLWIGFNGHNAKMLLDDIGVNKKNAVINCGLKSDAVNLTVAIYEEMKTEKYSSVLSCTGNLYKIFAALSQILKKDTIVMLDKDTSYSHPIQRATEYIYSNFSNAISVSMVAEFVGLSRSYFSTAFVKEVGISPLAFMKTVRMNQAIYYMKNTELTIKEISHSVGYDNGLYFSKDFSKRFGMCPSKYRSNNK